MWPVSFEPTKTKNLLLAMLSYVQRNSPTFDTNSYNVNKNYQMKWYGGGRHRRFLWISFQLTALLKLFILMTFVKSLWISLLAELFRIPFSCGRSLVVIINILWEFSVTKPVCFKDVFDNRFCSPAFRLASSSAVEPFLWLII